MFLNWDSIGEISVHLIQFAKQRLQLECNVIFLVCAKVGQNQERFLI